MDDHSDTRYVLIPLLKHLGYDASEVGGGQEAIDFLGNAIPELVILDCNMPCVDGLSVLRAIRGDPRLREVPVVIFSADRKDMAEPAYEELGIQDWIVKGLTDWDKVEKVISRYAALPARDDQAK